MAHIPASSRNNIRPSPIQATCRHPKLDPRGSDQDCLPPNGMHVLILHTAQRPCANSRTHNYRVWKGRPSGDKCAVDDLLDVLHRRADVPPTCGRKGFVEPVEVIGRVDANSCELQSDFEGRRRKEFRWDDFELGRSFPRQSNRRDWKNPHPQRKAYIGHHFED